MVDGKDILNSYCGVGKLLSKTSGVEMDFDIKITVHLNGDVNVVLMSNDVSEDKMKISPSKEESYSFNGDLDDNQRINIPEMLINEVKLEESKKGVKSIRCSCIPISDIYIWRDDLKSYESILNRNCNLEIGILNFLFGGLYTSTYSSGSHTKIIRDWFKINILGRELIFKQVKNYKETKESLKKSRDILLTSHLLIKNTKFSEIENWLQDLLWLLSYSQKTLLSKFYTKFMDDNGNQLLIIYHCNKKYPYSGSSFIDARHLGNKDIETFVETTFEKYQKYKASLKLDVIFDIICQAELAKVLESSYLLLICALDLILTTYITENKIDVPHDSIFIENRKNCVKNIVRSKGYDLSEDLVEEIVLKLSHKTFKNKLKTVINALNLSYSDDEINRIRDNRNKIVHELRFNDYNQPIKDYHALKLLLDRIILKILGYDGYVLNYTNEYRREKIV